MSKRKKVLFGLLGLILFAYAVWESEFWLYYLFFFYVLTLLTLKFSKSCTTLIKKSFLGISVVFVISIVLFDMYEVYYYIPNSKPRWEQTNWDDRFTLSLYRNSNFILPYWFFSRGTLVLRENRTGKVLQRALLDLNFEEPEIRWSKDRNNISIISIGVWDLPPLEPGN